MKTKIRIFAHSRVAVQRNGMATLFAFGGVHIQESAKGLSGLLVDGTPYICEVKDVASVIAELAVDGFSAELYRKHLIDKLLEEL